MDLIAHFAFRLFLTVIKEMLGIPEEDQGTVFKGGDPALLPYELSPVPGGSRHHRLISRLPLIDP